jgi:putative phosphoesterase
MLYHGPRNPFPENYAPKETIPVLADLGAPVVAIRGNNDAEIDEMLLPFPLAGSLWILTEACRIFAIHGHQLRINGEGGRLEAPEGAVVLSGHTHIPTAEKRETTHFWNPGSVSLPKQDFPPSFGWYEDGRFEVRTFDGRVLMSDSLR